MGNNLVVLPCGITPGLLGVYWDKAVVPDVALMSNVNEHKRAKRWTALLFSSSKPKPSELQLRKGALLRLTPRPCLAQAPLPLPISLASRISAAAPLFKNPLAGPLV